MLEAKVESPKIVLPEDLGLVKRLQKKLVNYEERIAAKKASDDYQSSWKAPEVKFAIIADLSYKKTIIETVLLRGEVSTHDMSRDFAEKGLLIGDDFNNACGVIDDYCKTGGADCYGGQAF